MPSLTRLKNQLVTGLASRFPSFARKIAGVYAPDSSTGEIPWTPLRKPLTDCRIALVTTAGIHHRHQPPFNMDDCDGDPSWRELNGTTLLNDFTITHNYYDHSDAERDPNIIFPIERLREFASEGRIGQLATRHYGFMGHITGRHIATLTGISAPQVAHHLQNDQVDLVLLTPA
ncbi:MAG: hypothetical protein C0614_12190 [Desulfuromonas sp.]|nr:MAG: hypothetical protein C0614_12190 [Desulfuromonas sp.]